MRTFRTPENAAGPAALPAQCRRVRGFTMVELLIVLFVLSILAGIAVSAAGDATRQAASSTTRTSLVAARDAIVGIGGRSERAAPSFVRDLGRLPTGVHELLDRRALPPFDPASGLGWRGPYVLAPRAFFGDPAGELGLPAASWAGYALPNDPALHDAWGRPIVLQLPDQDGNGVLDTDERRHARLVSAGPDGAIDTPRTLRYPPFAACGDDLVLYLQVADLRQ